MLDDEALAQFHDGINTVLDLVDAYRAACLERGYSPTAAERMAMDYHQFTWATSIQKSQPPALG